METTRAQERREVLRRALLVAVVIVASLGPTTVLAGTGGGAPGAWSIGSALLLGAVAAAGDALRARRERDGRNGPALRLAIRDAIRTGRLPEDADPDTWTRPVAERLRAVGQAPWVVALGALALAACVVVGAVQHHLDVFTLVLLGLDAVILGVLLVDTIRDRVGHRGVALATLLDELDARADAAPVAR